MLLGHGVMQTAPHGGLRADSSRAKLESVNDRATAITTTVCGLHSSTGYMQAGPSPCGLSAATMTELSLRLPPEMSLSRPQHGELLLWLLQAVEYEPSMLLQGLYSPCTTDSTHHTRDLLELARVLRAVLWHAEGLGCHVGQLLVDMLYDSKLQWLGQELGNL